ncbi:hypothetical protein SCHPADRAFT_928764, partial [Schizopora paradoxa]
MNLSIDDSSPDPLTGTRLIYECLDLTNSKVHGWNVGQDCGSGCSAHPDPSQVFEGTWHDASTRENGVNSPIASTSFTGVAVYVIGINIASTPETSSSLNNTRMFFQIDGAIQGSYNHTASIATDTTFSYGAVFFAQEGLSNELHNITIICGDGDPNLDSICLLDRIIYSSKPEFNSSPAPVLPPTAPTPEPKASRHVSSATIAGSAAGSMLFLALLVGIFVIRQWRHRRRCQKPGSTQNSDLHATTITSFEDTSLNDNNAVGFE